MRLCCIVLPILAPLHDFWVSKANYYNQRKKVIGHTPLKETSHADHFFDASRIGQFFDVGAYIDIEVPEGGELPMPQTVPPDEGFTQAQREFVIALPRGSWPAQR